MITLFNKMPITVFGSSHDDHIGITIKNYPQGLFIDEEKIQKYLKSRTAFSLGLSKRKEDDEFRIISGLSNGFSNGEDLTIIILNKDIDSTPYLQMQGILRPSHADFVAWHKYHDHLLIGGGVFSGRMSALYMVLGAISEDYLNSKNINIYARLKSLKDINDEGHVVYEQLDPLFPVASKEKSVEMINLLKSLNDDAVGGVVEICIKGLPIGLGSEVFGSLEAELSQVMFAIPGIKGIEFGAGFAITTKFASEVNDQMYYEGDTIKFSSNNSGGIQGGLSNGEDLIFRIAVKPTPSIAKEQNTVDVIKKKNVKTIISGRHDKAFILKVIHVARAMTMYSIFQVMRGTIYE